MIVLDASAAIEWLLQTSAGARVEARIFVGPATMHVPDLLDVEVAQGLRRAASRRVVTAERAEEALLVLADLACIRHAHDDLLWRIWELRHNLTAYDAAYVALAEALDAPLVTCDAKIASARGHRARIEVI